MRKSNFLTYSTYTISLIFNFFLYLNIDRLPNDDYCKIFKLVTHEDVLNTEEYFQRTLMADLMSQYLKNGMFFESDDNTE